MVPIDITMIDISILNTVERKWIKLIIILYLKNKKLYE